MDRDTKETLFFLSALGVLFLAVLLACLWYASATCSARAEGLGLEHRFGPVQGCLVKVGERYAPIEYIRITDDEKIIISGDGGQ